MKVLVVGPQFPDSFARNISETLTTMGHQVTCADGTRVRHHGARLSGLLWTYAPKAFPSLEIAIFRKIVRIAKDTQPDLVLVTYGLMPPDVVEDLKNACNGRVVCWFIDPVTNMYRYYVLASKFHAVFLKEPFLVRTLRDKLGANVFYLPECCNPMWHRRASLTVDDRHRYGCDLAAQGSLHYYRARMLEPFESYDLKIWGSNCPSWLSTTVRRRYTNRYITQAEKAKALQSAKIVVNTMQCSEIEGVNCTLFEAAGCGAFQITDSKPALPELFEPESEIVIFRTREELKEKVDYYLAHPKERREITDRAYARAHHEHTYEIRLKKIFQILGLETAREIAPEVALQGK